MAWALVERDAWGVTARMSVDFRRPILVGQAIRAEGWIVESKRRIKRTAGRIVDTQTGQELATAEATYVAATEARKRELKERYGVDEGAGSGRERSGRAIGPSRRSTAASNRFVAEHLAEATALGEHWRNSSRQPGRLPRSPRRGLGRTRRSRVRGRHPIRDPGPGPRARRSAAAPGTEPTRRSRRGTREASRSSSWA